MRKRLRFPVIPKRFSLRKQNREGSCGPNGMRYVIAYYKGLDIPEWQLINMSCCSQSNGAPIDGMARIAKNFNLNYELMHNSSISDLVGSINEKNPVVLLIQSWGTGHYVVANGYDDKHNKIFYYDPLYGKTKQMNYETLDKKWHGVDLFERNHLGIFFKN